MTYGEAGGFFLRRRALAEPAEPAGRGGVCRHGTDLRVFGWCEVDLQQAVVVGGDDAAGDGLWAGGFPRDDWRLDFVTGAEESFSNEMAGARLAEGGVDRRGTGVPFPARLGDDVVAGRVLMRVCGPFARGWPWRGFYSTGGARVRATKGIGVNWSGNGRELESAIDNEW